MLFGFQMHGLARILVMEIGRLRSELVCRPRSAGNPHCAKTCQVQRIEMVEVWSSSVNHLPFSVQLG